MIADIATTVLLLAGGFFFMAGTIGLLRFPDIYTRLHALTKAENVGLGLLVCGLALQAESFAIAFQLIAIWLLVQVAAASVAHLIARSALRKGIPLWKR